MTMSARVRGAVEHRRRRFLSAADLPPAATEGLSPRQVGRRTAAAPGSGLAGPARILPPGPITDQGRTPACFGFSIANAIMCRAAIDGTPAPDSRLADAYGMQVYRWALSGAPWRDYPGQHYFPIYALQRSIAETGVAATTMDELADAIRDGHPVVISVQWYASMSGPRNGRITVTPDDRNSFHAVTIVGFDPACDFNPYPQAMRDQKARRAKKRGKPLAEKYKPQPAPGFLIRNSWGTWGDKGTAWIRATDLADLLARGSEQSGNQVNNAHYATGWSAVDPADLYEADKAKYGA